MINLGSWDGHRFNDVRVTARDTGDSWQLSSDAGENHKEIFQLPVEIIGCLKEDKGVLTHAIGFHSNGNPGMRISW